MTAEDTAPTAQNQKPLVTFALFAYNQEKYIREAVEGAFSQTYEPLEIILSDDCSTDRTFEIMQEMAAAYQGRHTIRVRRNDVNLCIVDHVLTVGRLATGGLMVVAAGDDISLPERTAEYVKQWVPHSTGAIFSDVSLMDDDGKSLKTHQRYTPLTKFQIFFQISTRPVRYAGIVRNIPGYSAAYSSEIVANLPLVEKRIFNEDSLMSLVVNFEGRGVEHIPKPLVKVRLAKSSVSVRVRDNSLASLVEREEKMVAFSLSQSLYYDYLRSLLRSRQYDMSEAGLAIIDKRQMEARYIVAFSQASKVGKLTKTLAAPTRISLSYALSRIFGVSGLYLIQRARNAITPLFSSSRGDARA